MGGIQGIVSDFDGTLVDSEPVKAEAWRQTLAAYKVPCGDTFYWDMVGQSGVIIASEAIKRFGIIATTDEIRGKNRAYYQKELVNLPLIPGTLSFLRSVPEKVQIAVASSMYAHIIVPVLERGGLGSRIKIIVSGPTENLPDKPNPAVYLRAASLMGVPTENCVALEDSQTGVIAAQAAGFFCVGYSARGQKLKADVVKDDLDGFTFSELELLVAKRYDSAKGNE